MEWRARALLNSSLPNSSTTQFEQSVSLANGDPGIMEVQHWAAGTTLNWRIPIATIYPIQNAVATVTLPGNVPSGTVVQFVSNSALQTFMANNMGWSNYTWTSVSQGTQDSSGAYTFNLGDMAAYTGHAFYFSMTMPAGTSTAQNFLARVVLTGTYNYGQPSSCQPLPVPVPTHGPMTLGLLALMAALTAAWQLRPRR